MVSRALTRERLMDSEIVLCFEVGKKEKKKMFETKRVHQVGAVALRQNVKKKDKYTRTAFFPPLKWRLTWSDKVYR